MPHHLGLERLFIPSIDLPADTLFSFWMGYEWERLASQLLYYSVVSNDFTLWLHIQYKLAMVGGEGQNVQLFVTTSIFGSYADARQFQREITF